MHERSAFSSPTCPWIGEDSLNGDGIDEYFISFTPDIKFFNAFARARSYLKHGDLLMVYSVENHMDHSLRLIAQYRYSDNSLCPYPAMDICSHVPTLQAKWSLQHRLHFPSSLNRIN